LWWFARHELRADRHATPPMADRYRTLARLLDGASDSEVRVDDQVAILLVDERHKDGTASRAFMRFDRNELAEASDAAWRTPVVFHQFTLDTARPVVRHRIGAVTFTRGEDGRTRMADVPQPQRRPRDLAKTPFLLDRTAADIPPVPDSTSCSTRSSPAPRPPRRPTAGSAHDHRKWHRDRTARRGRRVRTRPHRAGVARVPAALPDPQARTRRMWAPLRHTHARRQLRHPGARVHRGCAENSTRGSRKDLDVLLTVGRAQ
jgi:hypothetical protein